MRRFVILGLLVCGCGTTGQLYRLPYADGVEVEITRDHNDHIKPEAQMFDLRATQPHQLLVAAASGWVREIEDEGSISAKTNNYVWIEHPLDYCQPTPESPTQGPVVLSNCRKCATGIGKCNEWTLYAHMAEGSVRGAAGLTENDWVEAGQEIGEEGEVGFAKGPHVHFTVFKIDRSLPVSVEQPTVNGDYEAYAKLYGRPELVPMFCTAAGLREPVTGDKHIASACP